MVLLELMKLKVLFGMVSEIIISFMFKSLISWPRKGGDTHNFHSQTYDLQALNIRVGKIKKNTFLMCSFYSIF